MSRSLTQLAAAVEADLGRAPDTRTWRNRVRNALNQTYLDLWGAYDWPWRRREQPLWVYPDFELGRTELIKFNDTGVPRVFDIVDVRAALSGTWPADDLVPTSPSGAIVHHIEHLVGAEVGLENPSAVDLENGNWTEGPFLIERAYWTTAGGQPNGPAYPNVRLWLEPRAQIRSLAAEANEDPLTIRYPRYLLPYDLDQLIEVTDGAGVPLAYLSPTEHEWMGQGHARPPHDGGGVARGWTWDHSYQHTPPMGLAHSPNLFTTGDVPIVIDSDQNVSIRENITGQAVAGASTLVQGTRYRFAVCWYYAGRFGPLSNVVEVTPTPSGPRARLTNLPTLPASPRTPSVDYGWVLAVFMAEGDEAMYLLQYVDPPPSAGGTSTTLDISAPQATADRPWKRLRYEALFANPYQYIRLFPRPSRHERYQVRYWSRPTPLQSDEDVPRFHEAFHELLVYGAVMILTASDDGGSARTARFTRAERQYQRKLAEMYQHYFPGQHVRPRKGSILEPGTTRFQIGRLQYNGDR